jgi:hypothetical protein
VARRKTVNLDSILKAYAAEARRAERAAKGAPDDVAQVWLRYAADTRRHAADLARRGVDSVEAVTESESNPVPVAVDEWAHLPADQAAWARHLAELDRQDLERFARRREGVKT